MSPVIKNDPCSRASWDAFRINHVTFDWDVKFAEKTISGSVDLNFIKNSDETDEIVNYTIFDCTACSINELFEIVKLLDTRDLDIHSVLELNSNAELTFKLSEANENLGTALHIDLSKLQKPLNKYLSKSNVEFTI
jgi:hypothetical protein